MPTSYPAYRLARNQLSQSSDQKSEAEHTEDAITSSPNCPLMAARRVINRLRPRVRPFVIITCHRHRLTLSRCISQSSIAEMSSPISRLMGHVCLVQRFTSHVIVQRLTLIALGAHFYVRYTEWTANDFCLRDTATLLIKTFAARRIRANKTSLLMVPSTTCTVFNTVRYLSASVHTRHQGLAPAIGNAVARALRYR